MARIAVGGFLHETNTFVPGLTLWDAFAQDGAWPGAMEGEAIFAKLAGLNLGISGFMHEATLRGHEVLPLAWAMAQPSGGPEKLGAVVLYLLVGAVLSLAYLAWCRRRRRLSGPAGAA